MANLSSPEDLSLLKRSDLQKLAKHHGIKANLKNDKLRNALSEVLFTSPKTSSISCASSGKATGSSQKSKTEKIATPLRTATPKLKLDGNTPKLLSSKPGTNSRLGNKIATPRIVKTATPRRVTPKTNTPRPKAVEPVEASGKQGKRRTFDKDEAVSEQPAKRQRRNTYDKDEPSPALIASPSGPDMPLTGEKKNAGVEEMLTAMSGHLTDEQMKQNLLNALSKRVPEKEASNGDRTKLPRYTGLVKNALAGKKPTTPGSKDWERIHNKHFSKMQSIGEYLSKKRERTAQLSASMKKIKHMQDKMKSNVDRFKSYHTPPSVKKSAAKACKSAANMLPKFASPAAKKFIPTVTSTSRANFKFGKKTSSTPATVSKKPFAPTVTSVSKANFAFNGRKSALTIGSPAQRKSPRLSTATNENLNRTVTLSKTTPFKFGAAANTSTMNTSLANRSLNSSASGTHTGKFDLKASLSKPLSWKPHIGTLKPFSMQNSASFSSQDVKEVTVKSKSDRRAAQAKQRADRRLDIQLQRRGLNA